MSPDLIAQKTRNALPWLVHRLRRWTNIKRCYKYVLAGMWPSIRQAKHTLSQIISLHFELIDSFIDMPMAH